ncbi:MAG: hypothetical protein D6729_11900 [Deltaproteobacteria bacterium]|nr:MAG: hypothetical protein D6729_11900 [Deltaproteobacteria bacterium]
MRIAAAVGAGLLWLALAFAVPPPEREGGAARPAADRAASGAEPGVAGSSAAQRVARVPLPPGGAAFGVHRAEPVAIREGMDHETPSVAITPDGALYVAVVSRYGDRERLFLRRADSVEGPLGEAIPVSDGARAWHPRLAAAADGAVWVAWCGRDRQPRRGDHRTEIYLRRLAPEPGPTLRVTRRQGRDCDPDLDVGPDGTVHVVWEQADRARSHIAWRAYSAAGAALGPAEVVSSGRLDRRPTVAATAAGVVVAWDSLEDDAPTGAADPDYDVHLRRRGERGWEAPVVAAGGPGIQAAPRLAEAPDGALLLAYHASLPGGLVKAWDLVRIPDPAADPGAWLRLERRPAPWGEVPAGEQQGAEFPALAVTPSGRIVVAARPSQGAFLAVLDDETRRPVLDLTRRGWGARGMYMDAAAAADGTVVLVRRARHEAVLERFTFDGPGRAPQWVPRGSVRSAPAPAPLRVPAPPVPRLLRDAFPAGAHLYWGDVHMHSAASDGTGPPDEIYARAFVRGLHFAVLTDHDYVVGSRLFPSEHAEIAWITDLFDGFEGFTTLHAYEWTTPPRPRGSGHRNVYFRGHAPTPVYGYRDGYEDTPALNRALRRERAFTAPHHAAWTGTDWEHFDETVQRHFEIVSVHGAFERPGEQRIRPRGDKQEGFATYGLALGAHFGFLGGSDAHGLLFHHGIGRRRDPWRHGLTGVVVQGHGRAALWDALYARRTFATSGRPWIALAAVDGIPMGGEGKAGTGQGGRPTVRWHVKGPGPLSELAILRDGEVVHEVPVSGEASSGRWIDAEVSPGAHSYYLRAVEGTEGPDLDMVWTSPVFVTVEEAHP